MSTIEDQKHSSESAFPISPQPPTGFSSWMAFVLFGGVLLPAGVVGAELILRICSSIFDPMPSKLHIFLLAMVPAGNLLAVWACYKGSSRYLTATSFILGMGIGTALIYSIQFLPLVPISVIAIIIAGIGLLGLSPFLALAASLISNKRLKEIPSVESARRRRAVWLGVAASMLALIGFALTEFATMKGLDMTATGDEAAKLRGIKLIRTFGNKNTLLRQCYDLSGGFWLNVFNINLTDRGHARVVYYKVTGESFNSVPPPKLMGPRQRWVEDFEFDSDVGGTAVNGAVRSLSMLSSRMDAVIDPSSYTSYTEWVLEFKNSSGQQREARAEIALPPDGVVSRLTLWVNGEEREAAFSTVGKVREAYQQVAVVQRRDPVLVTTCGPDRVLMQCFPVPPNGGTMKIRLGITAPLRVADLERPGFMLPRFIEKNFEISQDAKHSVMIDAPAQVDMGDADIRGKSLLFTNEQLKNSTFNLPGDSAVLQWTPDMLDPHNYAIVQRIVEKPDAGPKNLTIVIDGSKRLADSRNEIVSALSELPEGCRFSIIAAEDETRHIVPLDDVNSNTVVSAQNAVRRMNFVGGNDNRSALIEACKISQKVGSSVILWIHGPQPLSSDTNSERLLQLCERSGKSVRIIAVSASDGRNSILSELEKTGCVDVLHHGDSLETDLKNLFSGWKRGKRFEIIRERAPIRQVEGTKSSSHIAKLWARDEVMRMTIADSRNIPDASMLAAKHQLVTAVSGAVVLETQQQYEDAGLEPVDPKTVPSTVPEPATWLALASGLAIFATARRRGRK